MNSECIRSRFDLVRGLIHTIGLNAPLFIQGKMPEEGTRESFIIAVSLVLNFERVLAGEGICVSMLMGFLNAGCILHNIEPGFARMGLIVQEEFASLPTPMKSLDRSMFQPVLLFLLPVPVPPLLWILLQPSLLPLCRSCLPRRSLRPCRLPVLQLLGLSLTSQHCIFLEVIFIPVD